MGTINRSPVLPVLAGIALLCIAAIFLLLFACIKRIRRCEREAISDDVTGALNSNGFHREVTKYISSGNLQYAFVTMRVRNFPQIMQTFGNSKSHQVLIYLHKILKSQLSSAEPIARIDSGVFCFLLKNRQESVIRARLTRICESANQFNQKKQIPYGLDLYFGIYIPENSTEAPEEMLEKTLALLDCDNGDENIHFYQTSKSDAPSLKWELIEQMDRSLLNGDFLMYLQPKVRLGDSRVVGAEALIRWRHPQRGMLTPEMFIPQLEEYHQISRYDLHLFELVCQHLAQWVKAGWQPCPISLNLSCETLETPCFMEPYARMGQQYGIDPEWIEFELSDVIQHKPQKLRAIVDEIHSHGFRCALDNFGRSSTPLDLLRELDVDTLKLDSSLLSSENNSRRNRFVVEAILKVASQMQIHTVAEGIDNASQVQYLKQAGCDMIQGFYYFQPMSVEEFQNAVYQDGNLRYVESDSNRSSGMELSSARHSAGNIVMFSLLTGSDRVIFSDLFSPILEGKLSLSNALSLFRQSDLIHENDRKDFFHLLDRCSKEDGWVENAIRFYTARGRYEWLEVHLHKEYLSSGETIVSGTLVNMAGWKNEVDRWKEKANRDALTGLYNREYFESFTSSAMEKAQMLTGAIIFVDIDDFKKVNDTLGHVIGDDVICCVAKRILGIFRHTDIVARYGGDEFVVFVNGINRSELQKRLQQLCEGFRFPYRNDTIEYQISGSIGAAMYPEDGTKYLELLDHADSALYVAKQQGKNRFVFYQPSLDDAASH